MVIQSKEEIRRLVLENDAKMDVSIYLAVPMGIISFIAFVAALSAAVMARALEYFRADVSAYWMSCVPFMFPVVTGIYAGYKKQFSLVSVHFSMLLLALLVGGLGYAVSLGPIFINREDCAQQYENMGCVREPLSYLYLVSGALAVGFSIIGFLFTISACYHARKRINRREHQEEVRQFEEAEEKKRELRRKRSRALSLVGSIRLPHHKLPDANGVPQESQAPRARPLRSPGAPQQPASPTQTQSTTAASPATSEKTASAENGDVKTAGTSFADPPGTTTRL